MGNLFYTEYHVNIDSLVKTIDLNFPDSPFDTYGQVLDFINYNKYDNSFSYPVRLSQLHEALTNIDEDYEEWQLDIAEKLYSIVSKYALSSIEVFYVDV